MSVLGKLAPSRWGNNRQEAVSKVLVRMWYDEVVSVCRMETHASTLPTVQ